MVSAEARCRCELLLQLQEDVRGFRASVPFSTSARSLCVPPQVYMARNLIIGSFWERGSKPCKP